MKSLEPLTEERAVSPVIGVILMVAITVILAAVIGTFVLGIAPGDDPTPQVQLSIQENTTLAHQFELKHNGGSTLDTVDLVVVLDGDTATDVDFTPAGEFGAGETVLVNGADIDGATEDQDVVIRHEPSGGILASNTINISDS